MNRTKYLKGVVAAGLLAALCGCEKATQNKSDNAAEYELDTQKKKVSYIVGLDTVNTWTKRGVPLDDKAFALAIRDVMANKKDRLSEDAIAETLATFEKDQLALQQELLKQQEQAQALMEAEFNKQAQQSLAAGQSFLADNTAKDGVVTTDSGLQYQVLTAGEGTKPAADDTVEVHYRGTLLDGTEFDSSFKRGVPASFAVNQVIPGWTEALQLMQEGDKWQLFIPSDLAYGPGGTGNIGPNQVLQFEVELLKVKQKGDEAE